MSFPRFAAATRAPGFSLTTPRLRLRWPEAGDAAGLAAFAGDPRVAEMTATWPHPLPAGESARRIERYIAANAEGGSLNLMAFALDDPERCIGFIGCGARPGERELTVGYMLHPEVWGRGYAGEMLAAMLDAFFAHTDAPEILAGVRAVNPASRRVLERAGFRQTGIDEGENLALGRTVEVDWFALKRAAWVAGLAA